MRAVLLQVRLHPAAELQEQQCFRARCHLTADQLQVINAARDVSYRWRDLSDADVLFVGGSGEHSVTRPEPFFPPLFDVVGRWIDEGRPFLGSCWGHQLLGVMFGGKVVTDPAHEEVGTLPIALTFAGRADPLFESFPEQFPVHLGHHDRVTRLPPDFVELANSAACPHQVIRQVDAPVYGTQFHSEMSAGDMLDRLEWYRDGYLPAGKRPADLVRPTPEADGLLRRFVELYS
ncbi:MAG: type 1 glutamine amidotransferase [Acidobacteriota bacterium]